MSTKRVALTIWGIGMISMEENPVGIEKNRHQQVQYLCKAMERTKRKIEHCTDEVLLAVWRRKLMHQDGQLNALCR